MHSHNMMINMQNRKKYTIEINQFNKKLIRKNNEPILYFDFHNDFKELAIQLDDDPLQIWIYRIAKNVYVLDLPHLNKKMIIRKVKELYNLHYDILYEGKIELILDYHRVKENIQNCNWKNEYFEDKGGKVYFDKQVKFFDNFGDIIYHYISFYGKAIDLEDRKIIVIYRIGLNLKSITSTYRDTVKEIGYDEIFDEKEIIYY